MLNVSPIILFSEIAQQLRTKEGPRKILLFFTIVVKNNKLKQLRKLFYLHNSPVLTLLVNINITRTRSLSSLWLAQNFRQTNIVVVVVKYRSWFCVHYSPKINILNCYSLFDIFSKMCLVFCLTSKINIKSWMYQRETPSEVIKNHK